MSQIQLPPWAKIIEPTSDKVCVIVEVDSDTAYDAMLKELGVFTSDGADLLGCDQYWLEVAYQCIKMDVQAALEGSALDPRRAGKCAQINFTRAPRWELKKFKMGKGVAAATKGREARGHYKRLRGRIPFSG